ncbi:hypothetical protein [Streptosporangium amethystogenes]|uniref:hypothetical protein n=1 Tax=Streptosporangium amethystogenes TaxID=2002 RepID=UPI000689567D|nr:hypothetical protein [Streptosporangium amethystogenes]
MTTLLAAPARATYREVFAVRQFRVLFTGYALFLGGETVKMLALSVTVYASTGSPLLAALAYAAGFLPYALGGTLLPRPGRSPRRCCSPCPGSGSRTSWGWPGAS